MQQDPGYGQVGIDLEVEGQERPGGAGHVNRVLQEAVPVGVVHVGRGRRSAEGFADVLEDIPDGRFELGVADALDELGEVAPEEVRAFRGGRRGGDHLR